MFLELIKPYLYSFIVVFLAIDIFVNISLFVSFSDKLSFKQKKKVIRDVIVYSLLLTILFIFIGTLFFKILDVTIYDFKITAGILLLIFLLNSWLSKGILIQKKNKILESEIFSLSSSLIFGPNLCIVSLILTEKFGLVVFLSTLILNMLINWVILDKSQKLVKIFGIKGLSSFANILKIILAAFAVMLIREGVSEIFYK